MTKDTAAWDKPTCSARCLRLTPVPEVFRAAEVLFDFPRGIGASGLVVSHKRQRRTRTKTGYRLYRQEDALTSLVYRTKSVYYAVPAQEGKNL